MADLQDAVRTRLTAHAGTAALIGTPGRAYFMMLPQDATYPASVVQQISGPRIHAMGSDTDKWEGRVQVRACAKTRAGAKALAEQHRAALQRYSGTSASTVVHDCYMVNEMDEYEPDTRVWAVRQDYMVWVTE